MCVCVYEFLKLQYFRTQSIVLWDPTNPQHLFLPWKGIFAWMSKRRYIPKNQHQQCREPAWGTPPMAKDMRMEASAYAKAGSSLRKPRSQASTPKTRVYLLYCFMLSPTPLTLWGAVPHWFSRRRSKLAAPVNKNSWVWQGCVRSNLSAGRPVCVTGLPILLPLCTSLFTTSQP